MSYLVHHARVLEDYLFAYVIDAGATNNEACIKNNRKYFLPRGTINNYNVLIDGRNFYDQPISQLMT